MRELTVECIQLKIESRYPLEDDEVIFRHVAEWFWKKHAEEINDYLDEEINYLGQYMQSRPVKFWFLGDEDKRITLDYTETVADAMERDGFETVFCDIEVIPGAGSGSLFFKHAKEIMMKGTYSFEFMYPQKPGAGIKVFTLNLDWDEKEQNSNPGADRKKKPIVRTITIEPTPNYPDTPPKVTCKPMPKNDLCWLNGSLDYTGYTKNSSTTPWQKLVQGAPGVPPCANPLLDLVMDLREIYDLQV